MLSLLAVLAGLLFCGDAVAEEIVFDLAIEQQIVNFTGKDRKAMTINGAIPGPTLRFTEGDHAVIRVHNQMDVETSIHWHGILLPNEMDGVPFLTYPPIAPGGMFTYEFDVRQSGTYWYHSHTMLQEQLGLYGAIVIEPREKSPFDRLREEVVVLSDWTDENPDSVLRTLKRGSEWYSIRKRSSQSIFGASRLGMLGDYFSRELQRMPPMDLSDVYYDGFLLNGGPEQSLSAQPGERIRLRVIDGSASTFFYLEYAGGPMEVISADGQSVASFDESRLLIGVAETYDVIITAPEEGSYEFRATAQDGSGHASLWIGGGERHAAPDIPHPNLYSTMGGVSLKRVFALTPAGSMGMPGNEVEAGRFDQPGMNGMHETSGMKGPTQDETEHGMMTHEGMDHSGMAHGPMNHGSMTPDTDEMDTAGMGHKTSEMASETMQMDKILDVHADHGMISSGSPAAPRSAWSGLLAEDISSRTPLAVDGMSPERPWQPYEKLRALTPTGFNPDKPVRVVRLTLDGDMERFVWFLNDKPLSESDAIEIKRGEIVRFIMINRTMMHHPMHLHGHFFRVINAQGNYSPLKHTVNVAPMTTTVIEFDAEEFGDWFFHCHLLYHMESGMARVVHYQHFAPDSATAAVRHSLFHDPFYPYGHVDALSQMAQGMLVYANTRHILSAEWQVGWQDVDEREWEITPVYDCYINRFASLFAGFDFGGDDEDSGRHEGVFGVRYLLPLNVHSRAWVDTAGEFQFAAGKELTFTPRLMVFSEVEYDTGDQWEVRAGGGYLLSRCISVIGQWHSRFKWGGGLRFRF